MLRGVIIDGPYVLDLMVYSGCTAPRHTALGTMGRTTRMHAKAEAIFVNVTARSHHLHSSPPHSLWAEAGARAGATIVQCPIKLDD